MEKKDLYLSDEQLRDLAWHITCNRTPNQMGFMRDAAKASADYAVRKIIKNLPRRKSMLEDCAYQGVPPKKWVRETAPYYDGYNKAISEIEEALKKLIEGS